MSDLEFSGSRKSHLHPILAPMLILALAAGMIVASSRGSGTKTSWYKGNTHTHTLWSDGNAPPEVAADWYKSHGYQFLVLSDHNVLSEGDAWVTIGPPEPKKKRISEERVQEVVRRFGRDGVQRREKDGIPQMRLKTLEELRKTFEAPESFIFIQGEEITDKFRDKEVHHNSVNHTHVIPPPGGASVREVMQRALDAAKAEAQRSGRPILIHLNHPNFKWSITPDDIAHVLEERYFEVYNGNEDTWNQGDAAHAGTEQMWDHVLSLRLGKLGGEVLYALATDDTHNYYSQSPKYLPGRGWIVVRAGELSPDVITRAMLAGDFYASTGVQLEDVVADAKSLTVKIAAQAGVKYTTRFIGSRLKRNQVTDVGGVLAETRDTVAAYRFAGDELYVRAAIISDKLHPNPSRKGDLETAWVQPVVVRRPEK